MRVTSKIPKNCKQKAIRKIYKSTEDISSQIFPCNVSVEMWPTILKHDLNFIFADFTSPILPQQEVVSAKSMVALVLLIRLYQ